MPLTDAQVAGVFLAVVGYPPRAADRLALRVLDSAGPTARDLADFIHEHHLGDSIEFELVEAAVRATLAGTDPCA